MDLSTSLTKAFEEILDKMAFMVFETAGGGDMPPLPYAYTSRIAFKGKLTGTLNLYFTRNTAQAIARNLLGLRPKDDLFRGTVEDALGEFANILMGRTLALLDPEAAFDLQLPITQAGELPAAGAGPNNLRIEGVLDEAEPCRIVVQYQG